MSEELREQLANLAHKQWSGWMDYLFTKCIDYKPDTIQAEEGALIIPKWAVDRWKKQAKTPYSELTTAEMDSDRAEADKFLAVFNARTPDKELVDALERLVDYVEIDFEDHGVMTHGLDCAVIHAKDTLAKWKSKE